MRKNVSILLMTIMLIVAVHPVFAIHFCEGKLESVKIFDNLDTGCASGMDTNVARDNNTLQHIEKSCCFTRHLHLNTDDYQYSISHISIHLPVFECVPTGFDTKYISYINPELNEEAVIPPIPPAENGRGIISSICILRI